MRRCFGTPLAKGLFNVLICKGEHMTAEVAVMNKSAIALAADSAVTLQTNGKQKIYNSVNKLFALSVSKPVGIMIYGAADFTGIPWESVVKEYRKKLGNKAFPTLAGYTKDFFTYLQRASWLFPEDVQNQYYEMSLRGYFALIKGDILTDVENVFQDKQCITDAETKKIASSVIARHHKEWDKSDRIKGLPKSFPQAISRKHAAMFRRVRDAVFQKLPITQSAWRQLRQIAVMMVTRQRFPSHAPGVVIAGFGESEVFPSLENYTVDLLVDGRLKMKENSRFQISRHDSAAIQPFAQSEMVFTFVEGVDPTYERVLEGYLAELFQEYPQQIVDVLDGVSDSQKKVLAGNLTKLGKRLSEDFAAQMEDYRGKTQVQPIIDSVAALPKDELAAMAESLVSLTSFKRKVTLDAETVGGPIDVAVISKGDGLVWIKRKHYFARDLNPDFFSRRNCE